MDTFTWTPAHATGGPLDDLLRLVRERVPNLVVERRAEEHRTDDDDWFLIRMVTNPEPITLECRPGGRPPFLVHDEYSSVEAPDAVTGATAVYELLSA
ncbi:hypothetical protein [Kitasatospora sp. NPDC057015]|uniref:hypothetical protein n=1 Tax=Kitasatospora sp. NPDC057015 TaxID=3346001 RepID=UPI0036291F85